MSTKPPVTSKLDDALDKFYREVFNHAYVLGQEFPDEKNPEMIFDPCNADDKIKAHKAILSWVDEVIGEDEPYKAVYTNIGPTRGTIEGVTKQALRAEQRKRVGL